jgi:ubiquinone/menaquinone biosynthesis C-methylase UbiE
MNSWNRKRETIRHYNRIARIYDRQYAEEQEAKIDAIPPHLCLNEKSLVLDIGCGTGILFPNIAHKVQSITGVDASLRLLKKAKNRTKNFSNIHLICADSDYLPSKESAFNVVFAITLLQNLPNPIATLKEVERISQNEAVVAVSALKKEFSREKITRLLKDTRLEVLMLKTEEKLKDYVVICKLTK